MENSKAVLLLWIFYDFVLSCICYVFVRVCLYVLCGHLLGKGWPLGSRLWCLTVSLSLSLSHWYPGSGVVLDCINSWSLHPYLLLLLRKLFTILLVQEIREPNHADHMIGHLVFVMFILIFVNFPFSILGQVWHLIASIFDPCCLSYFVLTKANV